MAASVISLSGQFVINSSFGISIPVGDFGDDNANNDNAELALPGISGNLELAYQFTPNIGLSANFGLYQNKFDNIQLEAYFNRDGLATWTVSEETYWVTTKDGQKFETEFITEEIKPSVVNVGIGVGFRMK